MSKPYRQLPASWRDITSERAGRPSRYKPGRAITRWGGRDSTYRPMLFTEARRKLTKNLANHLTPNAKTVYLLCKVRVSGLAFRWYL